MPKGFARTQSQPSIHSLSRERGQFGMDAEIRTHQALQEAKPSECPKGDRDNKSEVYFKNRFFQQTEFIYLGLSKKQYIFEMGFGAQPQGGSQGRQSPYPPPFWGKGAGG
jgi:hypothetical protein